LHDGDHGGLDSFSGRIEGGTKNGQLQLSFTAASRADFCRFVLLDIAGARHDYTKICASAQGKQPGKRNGYFGFYRHISAPSQIPIAENYNMPGKRRQ
jgi:hypothetical protein